MVQSIMKNKFKEGDLVFAKVNPDQSLIVTCHLDRIYYCAIIGKPELKDGAYFERELINLEDKNQ